MVTLRWGRQGLLKCHDLQPSPELSKKAQPRAGLKGIKWGVSEQRPDLLRWVSEHTQQAGTHLCSHMIHTITHLAGWGISTSSLRLVLAPSGVPGGTQWDLCPQRGSLIEEENRKQDHQINTTNTTDQTHLINAKIRGQIFEKKNGPSLVFQIFSQYTYQLKEKNSNFTGEKFSL